jgi:hypothetical protein
VTRGKQLVSSVSPLPSSAAGFAVGVRDRFHSRPRVAAPAMSVAAAKNCMVLESPDE